MSPREAKLLELDLKKQEARLEEITREQQVQLNLSRVIARFWRDPNLTARNFFTFPDPVNNAESRLNGLVNALLIMAHLLLWSQLNWPWLGVIIAIGYCLRTLCGPRLDIIAHVCIFVLRPVLVDKLRVLENHFSPGPPRRFAQLCGLCMSFAAVILWAAMPGLPAVSYWVWASMCVVVWLQSRLDSF